MDVREKLVELLKTSACPSTFICDPTCKYYGFEDCFPERFADYLIANGVTVQEWISVDDRLPERTGSYIVCTDKGAVCTAKFYSDLPTGLRYEKPHWNNSRLNKHITHWCELPQPPKGE